MKRMTLYEEKKKQKAINEFVSLFCSHECAHKFETKCAHFWQEKAQKKRASRHSLFEYYASVEGQPNAVTHLVIEMARRPNWCVGFSYSYDTV